MKVFKTILFLLAFSSTLQLISMFKIEKLIRTVEDFEPIEVVEPLHKDIKSEILEPMVEPEEPEVTEVTEVTEPEEPEAEPLIDCRMDGETQQMILEKCDEYDVDFAFVMAIIFKESSFNPDVVSKTNDYGLMQINKINHKWLSEELGITNFLDPEMNVTAGLHILSDLFRKYENPTLVLMAYNFGEVGAMRKWNQGIYYSAYAEGILQQANIYNAELAERMGKNDQM